MSDDNGSSNLSEEATQLKEKIYEDADEKRNIWVVDVDLRTHHNLTFMEAALFGMITQLQCVIDGFCRAKNYYFLHDLGISDEWLRVAIKKLSDKGLIWYHIYNTKNGKRRHIVTSSSIRRYQSYLYKHKSWKLLRKFQQEFVIMHGSVPPPDNPSPKDDKETQVPDTIPPPEDSHRPSGKSGDGSPQNSGDAIKTTSLPNNKNGVTCKSSDELSAAASSSNLKEKLEQSFSAKDTELGLRWYELQGKVKRSKMKKPIACIVNAIKGGYAQEEVASKNQEVAAQLEKDREVKKKTLFKKKEMSLNEKLAHQLITKFSHMKGWRHKIHSKGFIVFNYLVERTPDKESLAGGTISIMPNGAKRYGSPSVWVDFDQPNENFKNSLKEFFLECQWDPIENKKEKIG